MDSNASIEALTEPRAYKRYQRLIEFIDSPAFHNAAKKISAAEWELSLFQLEEKFHPTKTAHELRLALWAAINRAVIDGRKIKISDLCSTALCTQSRIYQLFKDHPLIVVWLMQPIHDLRENIRPLMSELGDRLTEIIRLPIQDLDGKVNYQNIGNLIRVMKLFL